MSEPDDNTDFSDAFCQFLQESVTSVNAAELLLLIYKHPNDAWGPRDLVAKLEPAASVSEADAAKDLEIFEQRSLVERTDGGSVHYRPATEELDAHVRMLARLYNERPVTLIRVIYALRDAKIKTFADAFKIWRK